MKTCPHTHVFFNSNGSGICLDCEAPIERTKAFDVPVKVSDGWAKCEACGAQRYFPALPKQRTVEPTEAQLLRAELDFATQEAALLRTALSNALAIAELERSGEHDAPEYFWAHTRLTLHFKAALKHANELAVDRDTTSQKRKSL